MGNTKRLFLLTALFIFAVALTAGCTDDWFGWGNSNNGGVECNCNIIFGDWVDLGLPSGLLWATRNVGADLPTDSGDYYAWGETSPKDVYNWSTYRYCTVDGNGDLSGFTKYNTCWDLGSEDNLTNLQPGDDAATANYGGRTPTSSEWQELIDNTTSQWVIIGGVPGRCFTGSNGNSLFLPAAGRCGNASHNDMGSEGFYWSSTLDSNWAVGAWDFDFSSEYQIDYSAGARCDGFSVRAVRDAQ